MTRILLFIAFSIIASLSIFETKSMRLPRRVSNFDLKSAVNDPQKRPFCNAFTGCGRKRSNLPPLMDQHEAVEDSIGSLLELSAEPAIEDISRQIMSEAKLWEAIQEANMELNRRKQKLEENSDEEANGNSPTRKVASPCTFPPCYI